MSTTGKKIHDPRKGWVFVFAAFLLTLAYRLPLYRLVRFAAAEGLHSYIVLIPFISAYLIWLRRNQIVFPSRPAPGLAVFGMLAGLLMFAGGHFSRSASNLAEADGLAWTISSFLFLLFTLGAALLGKANLQAMTFPAGILVFCVPFPVAMEKGIQSFLQYSSAVVAHGLFILSGMPVFNEGTAFRLPGFCLEVAPQCSGIHSSLALFIVSLLAGHLFLHTSWKQVVFALLVIPLGILRNAVRIMVIGQLCVHIGPRMIDSPIHRHGGPFFFVLSLAPLFLLLWIFWKSDQPGEPRMKSGFHKEKILVS